MLLADKAVPHQRSIAASRYFVREFCSARGAVVSLFCNTGTDLEAAATLGHSAIGIDKAGSLVRLPCACHMHGFSSEIAKQAL